MAQSDFNWKDYHHQIYQIYHGMIALTLVPFALLFLEWDSSVERVEVSYSSPHFILIAQLIWVVGFGCWYVWRGEKVRYILDEEMTLLQKLKEFKQKNIYKYLILALAGFTSALAMWLQPSFIFVIAYFAVLIQYSFLRPSEDKIVRDMRLTKADRKKLHEMT
ncbi:MAG: hypothetical protein RLN88_13800 [Ekhidna sp.]|uniref:hypothetical protein n=1 Tax=Ekhidna sp. TaxID=2608089 RepID=UPI0032EEEE62